MKPTLSDSARGVACFLGAVLLASVYIAVCLAADITPGYTFTSGEQNITHTKLNNAASGTIATSFFTGKTSQTPVTADTLLFYADGDLAYRKTTVGTLFGNAPAIHGLSTINSVGDFSVATSKFTVASATGNTAVGGNLTVATNLTVSGATSIAAGVAGTLFGVTNTSGDAGALTLVVNGQSGTIGNALKVYGGATFSGASAFSNSVTLYQAATISGAATLNGNVTLGDAAGDTLTLNGTLAGTLQGTPTVSLTAKSSVTGADTVLIGDSAASYALKSVVLTNMFRTATAQTYVPGASSTVTLAHNLGGIPQSFRLALLCTNAAVDSAGYGVGDEVDATQLSEGNGNPQPLLLPRIEGTNIVVARQSAADADLLIIPKAGGAYTNFGPTNFNLKIYAVRFP